MNQSPAKLVEFHEFTPFGSSESEVELATYPHLFTLSIADFELVESLDGNPDNENSRFNVRRYADRVAHGLSVEVAQKIIDGPSTFEIVAGSRELDPDQIAVTGYDNVTNHRLSIFADGLRTAGLEMECIAAGIAVRLEYEKDLNQMSEMQKMLAYEGYSARVTTEATVEQRRIQRYAEEYTELLKSNTSSKDQLAVMMDKLASLKYRLIDPLQFEYEGMISEASTAIDTLRPSRGNFSAAAQYSSMHHQAEFPLMSNTDEKQRSYVFHELGHATSTIEYQKIDGTNGFSTIRARRIGFLTVAASKRLQICIEMHGSINEGYNDRKSRLLAGLDALGPGSYEEKREIVDHLLYLTGGVVFAECENTESDEERQRILGLIANTYNIDVESTPDLDIVLAIGERIWDAYYHASSRAARLDAYRVITQTLSKVAGPGFLNRLDTTSAVYGDEYVLDLLNQGAYEQFEYIRPSEIRERIKDIEADVIEISDLDESLLIELIPVTR